MRSRRPSQGVILLDRDATRVEPLEPPLVELRWTRREIENYLLLPAVLLRFAHDDVDPAEGKLLAHAKARELEDLMADAVKEQTAPAALKDPAHGSWRDDTLSDEYLPRVFEDYYRRRGLPNLMLKRDFHVLARFMRPDEIPTEVVEKLDAILEVARRARPEG